MSRMRLAKKRIRTELQSSQWREYLDKIVAGGVPNIGPLFACLPLEPLLKHRAAVALGLTIARLATVAREQANNVIRRFMWHLSEESGNIGWGIPEAFAETLVASPLLAQDFHRILFSYIIDLGHEDNYCDNDILRRSCFWGIGRLAEVRPELCAFVRPWLRKGLDDVDPLCRGMAAWALGRLQPDLMDLPALRRLAEANLEDACILFDGNNIYEKSISLLARATLLP